MSANAVLAPHGHYKDHLKMLRAGTAAEWTVNFFRWLFDAVKQLPSPVKEAPPLSRYSSYFY